MICMRRIFFVILIAAAAVACTRDESRLINYATPEDTQEVSANDIAGSAIIQVDGALLDLLEAAGDGSVKTKSEDVNEALAAIGIKSFSRVFPYAGDCEQRTRDAGLHRFYRIEYDKSIPSTKAGSVLESIEGVTKVEMPHKIHRRSATPDDPYFKWQWDLYNDGSLHLDCIKANNTYGIQKYTDQGADMNLMEVWENYTTGNPNVIVAVVDGGVDLNHPDLAANCLPGGPNGSKNFTDGSYTIQSDSHGTHVAGTIAAVRNNNLGVAGIAGGDYAKGLPGVKIMSCQIFSDDLEAEYDDDAASADAIKWGADHGAVISQNSWGYGPDDSNNDGVISSSELQKFKNKYPAIPDFVKAAVDYFIKYAGCQKTPPYNQLPDSPMKGGVVIFAAGNDAVNYDPICSYEPIVSVGAGTAGYTRAFYSNYGSWVDICAPGGDGLYDDYARTCDSQACYDDYGAYHYSRGHIYNLYATRELDGYDYINYGYMSGTSMACPHVSGAAALIVSYFGGPGFTNDDCKDLLLEGADNTHINNSKYVGPWLDVKGSFLRGAPTSAIAPDKVEEFSLEAVRKTVNISFKVPADEDDGKANTVLCLYGTNRTAVQSSAPKSIGSGVSTEIFTIGDLAAGATFDGTLGEQRYATTYYVKLYAKDLSNNYSEASEIKSITTPENHAPTVVTDLEGVLLYGLNDLKTLSFSDLFSDPDGDPLTIECKNNDGKVIYISYDKSSIRIKSLEAGTAEISVTVSDGDKTITHVIPVLVKIDAADPAETYPTPVTTDLVIRTEEAAETAVRIVSSSGKVVYEETKVFSGFDPLIVNFTGLAPGRYTVTISYNGKTYQKTIVKV